jgi:hypothetical protein
MLLLLIYTILKPLRGQSRGEGRMRFGTVGGILMALMLPALFGCGGSARQIVVLPGGGVVAVSSNSASGREKALALIAGHCRAGYEITREEEVPVGQRIREETTTDFDRRDRVTSTTEYRVRTRYEWRIHYTCR